MIDVYGIAIFSLFQANGCDIRTTVVLLRLVSQWEYGRYAILVISSKKDMATKYFYGFLFESNVGSTRWTGRNQW